MVAMQLGELQVAELQTATSRSGTLDRPAPRPKLGDMLYIYIFYRIYIYIHHIYTIYIYKLYKIIRIYSYYSRGYFFYIMGLENHIVALPSVNLDERWQMSPRPHGRRGWQMSISIRLGVSETFEQMVVSCGRESCSVKPRFINHGLLL
jgi:hypothetical protein